jgi:tetratricopeptide (TPR) repeat protein/energy-coupling factor transporter ATP-binding protein EcfA2
MRSEDRFNPFPGLRPFEPDEDHLFFGRERQTDEVLRRLRATRFLAVVGASGSGKSSLVRSGLIPSLHSGFMVQAGSSWRVAVFRPGEDPVGHLAAALDDEAVLGPRGDLGETRRVLLDATLRRGATGLLEAVRQAWLPAGENVLLIVDQFEELFRFSHSRRVRNSHEESVAFVRLLLQAAQQTAVPIYVVLTMRSDFIGDCMQYAGLPEAVNDGQYLVPRMSRDELRSAITGPVAVGGGEIAPRLVTRLLNEVGDDPDQLPVLQHALMRAWDHWERDSQGGRPIDVEDYDAIGTMKEALSRHAEEAYADLDTDTARQVAEVMFRSLTDTVTDGRGVRRPTSVEEIAEVAGVPEGEVVAVADVFRRRGRSFLMPPPDVRLGSRSVLDISHESLMRRWTRLIDWAEQERTAAEFYVRLSRAAAWHEQGTAALWRDPELSLGLKWRGETRPNRAWADRYDVGFDRASAFLARSAEARDREVAAQEQARRQKLRRAWQVAGALGVLLVVTVALAVYARRQQARADEQFVRADRNLALAKRAVDEMLMSAGRQSSRVAAEVPELEEFRRELLEKARDFYAEFGNQQPDSEALQREIARAHFRLGDIYRLLNRVDEARRHYDEASQRFAALVQAHPGNPEYRQSLGNVQNWMGELLRPLDGSAQTAEAAYDRALALQAALEREFPDDVDYRQELARTHYNRGILRAQHGGAAGPDYQQAITLLTPLATDDRPSARQELARALNNYGLLLGREQRPADAQDAFRRAMAIHEDLISRDPRNREYRSELAKFANNLAIVLLEQGTPSEALAPNQRALDLFGELTRPIPALSSELAFAQNLRGRVLEEQGRAADAGQAYRTAVDLLAPAAADAGVDRPEVRLRFGQALFDLGVWQMRSGDLDGGARSLAAAVTQHTLVAEHRVHLAHDYLMLARVALARGDAGGARLAVMELLRLLPRLSADDRRALEEPAEELRARVGVAAAGAQP